MLQHQSIEQIHAGIERAEKGTLDGSRGSLESIIKEEDICCIIQGGQMA
jgi:hypothetical protein